MKKIFHLLVLCGLVLVLFYQSGFGSAQSSSDTWSAPVNLSRSGSASNPILFVDSKSGMHLVWKDKTAGFMHSTLTEKGWAAPTLLLSAPWVARASQSGTGNGALDAPVPLLIDDGNGSVYAFWINSLSQLYSSRISDDQLDAQSYWDSPRKLSDSVLTMAVTRDPVGQLHLVYIYQSHTNTKQPGIYYLRMLAGSKSWMKESLLVSDAYFSSMGKDQANLSIAAGTAAASSPTTKVTSNNANGVAGAAASTVYVAWDNHPLKRVFLARSADGGQTWDPAKEIAGPASSTSSLTPFNINVSAVNSSVVLIWQLGQPGSSCSQFTQASTDYGVTWKERQPMLAGLAGCAQKNQFVIDAQNQIFLASTILDQVYLLAWNGDQWSEPQLQKELYGFINPDTFNTVSLQCHQFAFAKDNQMFSAGCDVTDLGDIWITSRAIPTTSSWFKPKSVWNPPVSVPNATQAVSGLTLIPDGDHTVHALWIQPEQARQGAKSINYARWDGDNWSTPITVLRQPDGDVTDLSAALSSHGRLLVAWSGGPSGRVYFSWADASKAINVAEWTQPQPLPSPQPSGSDPQILVDPKGMVDVVYAVPLNEDRGIYLVTSTDEGQSWSDPVKVFDGVAAGWSHIDAPRIYQVSNGRLGVIWSQVTLQGGMPVALYNAFTDNQGKNWSPAKKIADAKATWSQTAIGSDQTVSLVWLEQSNEQYSLRFAQSADGGKVWSRPATMINSENQLVPAGLLAETSGKLHLLLASPQKDLTLSLEHWAWDGEDWSPVEGLPLSEQAATSANSLASAMTQAGHLYVMYNLQVPDATGQEPANTLQFSDLMLKLSSIKQVTVTGSGQAKQSAGPTQAPTAKPLATISPTDTAAPTPVSVDTSGGNQDGLLASKWGGLAAGAVFSGLVIVAGVGFNRFNQRKR